jgi:hypothetical protein
MSNNHKIHEIANRGFSIEAANYEKTRPTYTIDSLNNLLEAFDLKSKYNEKINVLDLAAGTGKFTKFKNLNFYFFISLFLFYL